MTAAPRGDASSLFATPRTVAEHRADGSIVLRSPDPLRNGARCIGDWLEQWARQRPDAIFLAERSSAEAPWTTVTYAQALRQVRACGVLDFGAGSQPRASASDPLRQ
jgi:feruloyl-CoA synthase